MELVLIIGVVVVGIVVMLFLTRDPHEEKAMDDVMRASRIDPDRQFRRPPNEGDLL